MGTHFVCPHCSGHLKVGESIIFRVRNKRKKCGLLLLHPLIGNYSSIKHPEFEFNEGEALDFFCPLCGRQLGTPVNENLIYVVMIDNDGTEHEIYFSKISGEHSTFQVSGESVTATGEHSGRYTYFSISDRFTQYLKK